MSTENTNFDRYIDQNPIALVSNQKPQVKDTTFTAEELRDVNNIIVSIPDTAPIVILYAPQSSGKTMALLRMIRYLESQNYHVEAERVFRPATDTHYQKMCDGLHTMAYSDYAPGANDTISFMLAKVLDSSGHTVCQLLEAPGEHYFDGRQEAVFPTYIENIIGSQNRRTWVFFTEPDWGESQAERTAYANKIINMYMRIHQPNVAPDRVVFLFNQADRFPNLFTSDGKPNMTAFYNKIKGQYPDIFNKYINKGLKRWMFGKYDFRAVPFSAGSFTPTADKSVKPKSVIRLYRVG